MPRKPSHHDASRRLRAVPDRKADVPVAAGRGKGGKAAAGKAQVREPYQGPCVPLPVVREVASHKPPDQARGRRVRPVTVWVSLLLAMAAGVVVVSAFAERW